MRPPKSLVSTDKQKGMDGNGPKEDKSVGGGGRQGRERTAPLELFKVRGGSRCPCLVGYWFSRSTSSLEVICLPHIEQPYWNKGGVKFSITLLDSEPDVHTHFHPDHFLPLPRNF